MAEIEDTIKGKVFEILAKYAEKIKENLKAYNINASGATSESIRVEVIGNSVCIVAGGSERKTAPVKTLEIGRPGGSVPKNFKAIIYQWTIEKKFQTESNSHRWAISTIIAKNIEERGTARNAANVDVYSSLLNEASEEIKRELKGIVRAEILKQIDNFNR